MTRVEEMVADLRAKAAELTEDERIDLGLKLDDFVDVLLPDIDEGDEDDDDWDDEDEYGSDLDGGEER